jgi:hypothetical protein
MSRLPTRILFCLSLGLLNIGAAQASGPYEDTPPAIAAKEHAKVAFEASQAATRDLARARLEASQAQLRKIFWFYRFGETDSTIYLSLLKTAERTLRAALAVSENPAERWAFLEGFCSVARFIEHVVRVRYLVGRGPQVQYASARCIRLKGEMRLAKSGARPDEPIAPSDKWALSRPVFDPFFDTLDPTEDRAEAVIQAREKFAAVNTPLRQLVRPRWESARAAFQEREETYRAGAPDATLDLLLESSEQLPDAELAVFDKPSDRLVALARHWRHAWTAEQIVEAKYRFGRASLADLMQAREAHLDAETKLVEARARQKQSGPFWITPVPLVPEVIVDSLLPSPMVHVLVTREMAKAQFEASQSTAHDLALARRDAARLCQQERWKEYRAGAQDATLDLTLEASRRLLEAELAVLNDPAERVAAHESYWELTRIVEDIVAQKYELGRVSLADLAQARYDRLDAEIRLAEAQAKRKSK